MVQPAGVGQERDGSARASHSISGLPKSADEFENSVDNSAGGLVVSQRALPFQAISTDGTFACRPSAATDEAKLQNVIPCLD